MQREQLFILSVVEKVLAGHINLISYVDQAKFVDLMNQQQLKQLHQPDAHKYIYKIIQQNLAKQRPFQSEYKHQTVTVTLAPGKSKPQQQLAPCIHHHQHNISQHKEQQTRQFSQAEIRDQLNQIDSNQPIQEYYNNNINNQGNTINNQNNKTTDNIDIITIHNDDSISNKSSHKQSSNKQSKTTTNRQSNVITIPKYDQKTTIQETQKPNQNISINNTINNDIPEFILSKDQPSLQQLDNTQQQVTVPEPQDSQNITPTHSRMYSNEQSENQFDNQISIVPNSKSKKPQSKYKQDLQISIDSNDKEGTTKLDPESTKKRQQPGQYNLEPEKLHIIVDDANGGNSAYILLSPKKADEGRFSSNTLQSPKMKDSGDLNKQNREPSIHQNILNTSIDENIRRSFRSEGEFNLIQETSIVQQQFASQDRLRPELISLTSIEADEHINPHPQSYVIQVNPGGNSSIIMEAPVDKEASPNQRSQRGNDLASIVSMNLMKIEEKPQSQQQSQSQVQQSSRNIKRLPIPQAPAGLKSPSVKSSKNIQDKQKKDTDKSQQQQPQQLKHQKSEESIDPKSNTVESSQGEKSSRSRQNIQNAKPSRQLRIPANQPMIRKPSYNSPVDPEKVKQQEKERIRLLEYQKQIDQMRQEKELMEQYRIPESMPLQQKKQIIETLIRSVSHINDQDAKYQITLYQQRQEQVAQQQKYVHDKLEFQYETQSNCYNEMDIILESKLKLKQKDIDLSKITQLRFHEQIQTHFPGQQKEFQRDEFSPLKQPKMSISKLDPRDIDQQLIRKLEFKQESDLLKLFTTFCNDYDSQVKQCDMDANINIKPIDNVSVGGK